MKKNDIGKKMSVEELMDLTGGRRFGRGGKRFGGDNPCNDDVVPVPEYGIQPLYGIEPTLKYGIPPVSDGETEIE
ncbi:MAG: hypothetical protein ABF289_20705 [Clostridiales bacterium]